MKLIRDAVAETETAYNCSPARALEAVGERWSMLIMREAVLRGITRFSEFERRVGVERDILAARLDAFVGAGLMTVHGANALSEAEYLLTTNGRNLEPVIAALSTWADGWTSVPPVPAAMQRVPDAEPEPVEASEPVGPVAVAQPGARATPLAIEISLLGAFDLRVGGRSVEALAVGSQRLLAFLALHDRSVARIAMAGAMWPEASDERAGISLRSALSRLDPATRDAILSSPGLSLAGAVGVDLREGRALAGRLLQTTRPVRDEDLSAAAVSLLSLSLLPDWYDDWVVAEAEDWRQLRVSALEAQAALLIAAGRLAEAAGAARAAMKVDPLRESAHATLIRVHLAGGNQSEALRVYDRYRVLLRGVLDLDVSEHITALVAGIRKQ